MKLSAMPRAAQDEATLDVPPWTPRSQLSRLVTARTADDAEPSPSAPAEPPPPSPRAKIHTPPWLRAGLEVRTPDDAASASSGSELPTPAESPLTPLLLKPTQPMMCADCGELYSPPSCTTCRCAALAKVSLGKPREIAVPADAVWPAVAPAVEAPPPAAAPAAAEAPPSPRSPRRSIWEEAPPRAPGSPRTSLWDGSVHARKHGPPPADDDASSSGWRPDLSQEVIHVGDDDGVDSEPDLDDLTIEGELKSMAV